MGLSEAILGRDLSIDLGTSNTLVLARNHGVVVDEPTLVSVDLRTGTLISAGQGAEEILGRAPRAMATVRPLSAGMVADYEATEGMLRYFMGRANPTASITRPKVLICVPSGTTDVERRVVEDAGYGAGARKVYLLEEPMAAAIGAGLDVFGRRGQMIVDVGGGTTEVALVARGDSLVSISAAVGGNRCDQAISEYMRTQHSLDLGEPTSERVKIALGSAFAAEDEPTAEIAGRDTSTGLPRSLVIAASEIREALSEPISEIIAVVRSAMDKTPPEMAGDIMELGIVMSGGGSLLRGVADRMASETNVPVRVSADPLRSVVLGAGRVMDNRRSLDSLLLARPRRAQ